MSENPSPQDNHEQVVQSFCSLCLKPYEIGHSYPIFYGKKGEKKYLGINQVSQTYSYKTYSQEYYDVKMKSYNICKKCQSKGRKTLLIIGLVCLGLFGPICLIAFFTDVPIFFFLAMGCLAFGLGTTIGVSLTSEKKRAPQDFAEGNRKAIYLCKDEFRPLGFDCFWTEDEFKGLNLKFHSN